jgi:hypothetical protein
MVKIRVQGLPEDVEKVVDILNRCLNVLEESSSYKNRNSEYVRKYLDVIGEKDIKQ